MGVPVDRRALTDRVAWLEWANAGDVPGVVALDGDDLTVREDLRDDPDVRAIARPSAVEDRVARRAEPVKLGETDWMGI